MGDYDLVLRGGTVVDGRRTRRADLAIRAGRIAAVEPSLVPETAPVVDVSGALLLPGVVDAHVHPIHGESFESVSQAAAFGGVTTALHHVYPAPSTSLLDWLISARSEASRGSWVDFGFHARLRADSPEHLRELDRVAAIGVRSFKAFMAYSAPGVAVDAVGLLSLLSAVRAVGGLLLVHAEDQTAINANEGPLDPDRYRPDHYLSERAPSAEAEAVRVAADVAAEVGAAIYFVHISGRDAMMAVEAARGRGARVYAETCPHYLLLEAEEALGQFGPRAKIAPPLRSASDRAVLWAAVRHGRIDTLASDHCGYAPEEKEPTAVSFRDAGFGAPGVETMLPLMLDATLDGRMPLERLVELLAEAPARIFGLRRKGCLEVGRDADVIVVDPTGSTTLAASRQHGAAYYSLYEGRAARGRISAVYLRGEAIIQDGKASDVAPGGSFVPLHPA